MENNQTENQTENRPMSNNSSNTTFDILPPHSNKMVLSIICTIFCCLLGGIIAIVYSSKSNNLYNAAMCSNDVALRQSLYYQSVSCNKTATTWIIISIIVGICNVFGLTLYFVFPAMFSLLI